MTHDFYRLFTNVEENSVIAIVPIDYIYLPKTVEEHQELILLDVNCDGVEGLVNESRRELNAFSWILFKSDELLSLEDQLLSFFANSMISVKSEIFFYFRDVEWDRILVKQIYRTNLMSSLSIEPIGIISMTDDFVDLRSTQITSRRRQNLGAIHLAASMVVTNNDTLNHLSDYQFVFFWIEFDSIWIFILYLTIP